MLSSKAAFLVQVLAIGRGEKYIDNCYTIGYNSNTWFGYVLYPLIYHAVSATNPIVC